MATNETNTRKAGSLQAAEAPPADTPPESLDKVRDILFGSQMRAVDHRLQSLEERLREEHEALRTEFGKQLSELGTDMRKELQALNERLEAERAKRADDLKSLAAEMKDALRALEKRHGKLEEATNMADAVLRDQLLLQAKAASDEVARLGERLTAELQRSHEELASTKADRAALASLLTDMASRLGGTPGNNIPRG